MTDADPIADAAAMAPREIGSPARVEDQSIKVLQPVKGDPGLTVRRVLGHLERILEQVAADAEVRL